MYDFLKVEKIFEDIKENPNAMRQYSTLQVEQLEGLIKLTGTDLSKGNRQRVMVCHYFPLQIFVYLLTCK